MLEIARQSRARRLRQLLLLGQARPDRPARTWSGASAAGSTSPAPRCGRSTRTAPARWPAGSATAASTRSASASCTPTPTPPTRSGCATSCARSTPTRSSRSRSEVLREYREYERAMTTLVDAAVKPRLSPLRRQHRAAGSTRTATGAGAVLRDEVQRRRALRRRGRAPADHHRAVRPGRGRARRRADRRRSAGFDRVLTSDGGGTSTDVCVVIDGEPTLTTEGSVGAYPSQDPDDRRRHRRRRRRLDRLALARGHAQGRAAVGRRRPRPALLRQGRHRASPSPTPTWSSAGSRRTCSAARSRSTPTPPARASRRWPRELGLTPEACAAGRAGDLRLEPGQRAAPGHRQARPRRPRLHAGHLRRLRVAAAVPADRRARPARPCWCRPTRATCRRSGCSPSTSRTTTCRPTSPCRAARPAPRWRRRTTTLAGRARAALRRGGLRRGAARLRAHRRPALLRAGLRGAGAGARRAARRRRSPPTVADAFHAEHRALYGYDFADDADPAGRVGQPAGLRRSARSSGPRSGAATVRAAASATRARDRHAGRSASTPTTGTSTRRCCWRADLAPGDVVAGPGGHRGVRLDRAAPPRLHRPTSTPSRNLVVTRARTVTA